MQEITDTVETSHDLPSDILCECCTKILREPVVKAKSESTKQYEYFHKECFMLMSMKGEDTNTKYFIFGGKSHKKKSYPLEAAEIAGLKIRFEECGFSLRVEDDPKVKNSSLRIALFAHLASLQSIIAEREESDDQGMSVSEELKLKKDLLVVDEKTGQIKIHVTAMDKSRMPNNFLIPQPVFSSYNMKKVKNYVVPPAVVAGVATKYIVAWRMLKSAEVGIPAAEAAAAAIGTVAGLSVFAAVAIIGIGIILSGNHYSTEFKKVINMAKKNIGIGDFKQAERVLASEFDRNIVTRSLRWLATQKDEYAIAHLLRGICCLETKNEQAYVYFEKAYSDAQDSVLKGLALLGLIRVLAPESGLPVKMTDAEKSCVFQEKLQELQQAHAPVIDGFNQKVLEFTQAILGAVAYRTHDVTGLLNLVRARDIAHFKEAYLFRYMPGLGRKIEVIFGFLQGVVQVLDHMNKDDKSFIDAAKGQFEGCWTLIKQQNMEHQSVDEDEVRIVENIRLFMIKFAEHVETAGFYPNINMNDWLRELGVVAVTAQENTSESSIRANPY